MIVGWVETPDLIPCHVYDATGMEIRRIVRANTETGECWINPLDHLGYAQDYGNGGIVRVRIRFPAPLEVVLCPLGEDDWCGRCEALSEHERS